jgi:excinuclease UvrABC ATPase subunit
MNQQINLYLPEFRVKKDSLNAVMMGQILAGAVFIMLIVTAYDLFSRWSLNNELVQLREVLQEETQKTNELDEVLARRSQNSSLTARLDQAEEQLESSRQIREFLSQTKLGNVVGFSEYFKDISRASIEGLSVTEFSFSEGGEKVSLSGQAVDSAMVPRYVSKLEASKSTIRDQLFSPKISRSDSQSQFFNFELSTSNE